MDKKPNTPGTSMLPPLDTMRTYTVGKMQFVVEPLFNPAAKDTLATVILRLIQSDTETPKKR